MTPQPDSTTRRATETVEVPAEVAEVALRELNILIRQTDPTDNDVGDLVEPGKAMSPMARVKARLQAKREEEAGPDIWRAEEVIDLVDEVAKQTGAETSVVDPLQDDIFRARDAFAEELEAPEEDD